jgi:hypothetical protein
MGVLAIVWSTDFPYKHSLYEQVLINFASQAHMYGWDVIRTSHFRYDILQKNFSHLWRRDGHSYVLTDTQPTHIYFLFNIFNYQLIDIISHYASSTNLMLCSIAKDKYATYKLFSDYSPFTVRLSSVQKDLSMMELFSSSHVVLKPIYWAQWHWVSLKEKNDIWWFIKDMSLYSYNDWIVQDFIDFSWGIPWIVDGIHDVRLVVFGKKVIYVLVRVPYGSDFRCNISQNGSYFFIDFADLPMCMQKDAKNIIDRLYDFIWWVSCTYSVDIALWIDGKTYLIEFNSAIWLQHLLAESSYVYAERYLQGIFSLFLDS